MPATLPTEARRSGFPDGPVTRALAARLGTSGDSATPPPPPQDTQADRGEVRYQRHDRLNPAPGRPSSSNPARPSPLPRRSNVVVSVGRQLVAHVSSVHRCGSSHSCPTCAPVVRRGRAKEIERGVGGHLAEGGGALLLTLTTRHQRRDALAPRLAVLSGALHSLLKGAGWTRRRDRFGFVGAIRALEITYGANGWHPHAHILLLFARPITEDERADLDAWVFARWRDIVAEAGFGIVTRDHGVDLRQVTTDDGLSDYLTKVEGKGRSWSVGHELARADLKRGVDSMVPFELLAEFAATGDLGAARLWQEYEAATFGKQALRWSPGLKKRFGIEDQADVELAASEGADETYFRWLIDAALWRAAMRGRRLGRVLTACEIEAANRFAEADSLAVVLTPLAEHESTDWIGDRGQEPAAGRRAAP